MDKDTKSMIEIVNNNHKKEYAEYQKELQELKDIRRERRLMKIAVAICLVILFIFSIIITNMERDHMKRCISKGNTYDYCELQQSK